MKLLYLPINCQRSDSNQVIVAEPIAIMNEPGFGFIYPEGNTGWMKNSEFHQTYRRLHLRELMDFWHRKPSVKPSLLTEENGKIKADWRLLRHVAQYECSNGSGFQSIQEDSWRQFADRLTDVLQPEIQI